VSFDPEGRLRESIAELGLDAATVEAAPHQTIGATSLGLAGALERVDELTDSAPEPLQMLEPIGEGGMGVVHRGVQRSLGRQVAVKTLRADRRGPAQTRKLLTEAWITGSLEHPNVVPVHDILFDAGEPRIVLKHIEGTDWASLMHDDEALRDHLGFEDPLSWNLGILVQLCNAIHFAHCRGILHRDIKPSNVMIGAFGEVYVVDWGLAVALEDDGTGRFPLASRAVQLAGTPVYMAPEMLTGGDALSARTDVYLLGALLYEIVMGRPPHVGGSLQQIVASIAVSEPALDASIPAELRRLIRRAMAREPGDRFASADALRLALVGYLEHRFAEDLAARAREGLEALEAKLGDGDADAAYDLFGQCRFGFRRAMEAWPETAGAAEGLAKATELMVALELERGQPDAAMVLLRELPEPPEALVSRVEEARQAKLEEERAARALQRAHDPKTGRGTRLRWVLLLGGHWTLAPLVIETFRRLGREPTPTSVIGWDVVLLAVLVVVGVRFRRGIGESALNRHLAFGATTAVVAQLSIQVGGWLAGASVLESTRTQFVAWAAILATASASVDLRLLVPAVGYGALYLALFAIPDLVYPCMFVGNLVLWITLLNMWRGRG